jgi:hypothetical protein
MGRRPLPAVPDFTRDGRWSTYDVSVRRKMGGEYAQTGYPLKLLSPTNLARLGHFPPASQAGRLAGPVFYVYVFSLVFTNAPMHGKGGEVGVSKYMEFLHLKRHLTEFFKKKWQEAREMEILVNFFFKQQIQRYF